MFTLRPWPHLLSSHLLIPALFGTIRNFSSTMAVRTSMQNVYTDSERALFSPKLANPLPIGLTKLASLNVDNHNFVIISPESQVQIFLRKRADIISMSHMPVHGVSRVHY